MANNFDDSVDIRFRLKNYPNPDFKDNRVLGSLGATSLAEATTIHYPGVLEHRIDKVPMPSLRRKNIQELSKKVKGLPERHFP